MAKVRRRVFHPGGASADKVMEEKDRKEKERSTMVCVSTQKLMGTHSDAVGSKTKTDEGTAEKGEMFLNEDGRRKTICEKNGSRYRNVA